MNSLIIRSLTILLMAVVTISCNTMTEPAGDYEPADPDSPGKEIWNGTGGLNASFGTIDSAYSKSSPPLHGTTVEAESWGWKGEKVNLLLLVWSKEIQEGVKIALPELRSENSTIPGGSIELLPMKYLYTDEFLDGCGYRLKDTLPVHIFPDMLDNSDLETFGPMETRPVWITINIPGDAVPGKYRGEISIMTNSDSLSCNLTLDVMDLVLPEPGNWHFHLDLWQNPYAVARYHDVEPWSQEHLDLLAPLLKLLAGAGQKCITTTILDRPWGGQTYDPFGSMVTWIKNADGTWDFDYSLFDQYVTLAMACGIKEQINCYSMVPWGNLATWYDEASGSYQTDQFIPGTAGYDSLWTPFLYDFRAHLMDMGWLDITTIALDERGPKEMAAMFALLKERVPEIKVSMAGNYFRDLNSSIYDFSYNWGNIADSSVYVSMERRKRGQLTTYYVACGVPRPNNFTFSPPSESCYEPWFAAAMGFDGFLRWAYNSWVEDPVKDSRFRTWPSGDTYFVYPGARSSARFERLREGIQDFEKLRIAREELASDPSPEAEIFEKEIALYLEHIRTSSLEEESAADLVNGGKKLLYRVSKYLAGKGGSLTG